MQLVEKILKEYGSSFYSNPTKDLNFINYCLKNFKVIKPALKKLNRYTSEWKMPNWSSEEIKILQNIPGKRNLIGNKIYRGFNSKVPFDKKIYKPVREFTSWSLKKDTTKYFSSGEYYSYSITSIITNTTKYIDVDIIFRYVNNSVTYLYEKEFLTNEEKRLENLLDDIQLYNEYEVLIFNKVINLTNVQRGLDW